MKISVIIPVYNRLEHLRASVLCLLRQRTMPDELIISDDGSSQNVLDFINDLIPKAKFKIIHIYQEDKGFRKTRALNNAVKNSNGDLLIFCDQDLIFGEDYIERMKNLVTKRNFVMGVAGLTTENEKKLILQKLEKNSYLESIREVSEECFFEIKKRIKKERIRILLKTLKLKKRGLKLVGMSYGIFKDNYLKINGYDEKYQNWGNEDDDFGNRLTVLGLNGQLLNSEIPLLHLWHYSDPTKRHDGNDEYYYEAKKNIFKKNTYKCKYGLDDSLEKDEIKINILN